MAIVIPGPRDPRRDQTTTIEGVQYRIAFDYIQGLGRWAMSWTSVDGAPLVSGILLVGGADLLAPYRATEGIPQGLLYCYDTRGLQLDPGVDFRRAHAILYFPLSEASDVDPEAQARADFFAFLIASAAYGGGGGGGDEP